MKSGILLFGSVIILFLAAGGIGYLISIFNSLIQVKNNIGKAWGNIDVLLLQRNEEIPKLVDICKDYMTYEGELFAELAFLRTGYEKAKGTLEKTIIENKLKTSLNRLSFSGEQYPDLKAGEPFQRIMKRVSQLEETVADRRVFFNDSVAIYNTQIEKFPHRILAGILRYKPHPYLDLSVSRGQGR